METTTARLDWRRETRRGPGIPYLKGQEGEWVPRQPQWQHWGELWSMHAAGVEEAAGADDVGSEICAWATAADEE